MKYRIVVAITGASGSIYARQLLNKLSAEVSQVDTVAVVMTENAKTVWETELTDKSYTELPFKFYTQQDFYAPFASGSGQFNTMITRAADVMLKERRKLICMVRETPYNLIHLHNMLTVTQACGIICPASPSFYSKPTTLEAVAA